MIDNKDGTFTLNAEDFHYLAADVGRAAAMAYEHGTRHYSWGGTERVDAVKKLRKLAIACTKITTASTLGLNPDDWP